MYCIVVAALLAFVPARSGEAAPEPLRKRGRRRRQNRLRDADRRRRRLSPARVVANLHKENKFPMARDGKTALYFVTSKKSNKAQQFRKQSQGVRLLPGSVHRHPVLYTGAIEEMDDPALTKTFWAD